MQQVITHVYGRFYAKLLAEQLRSLAHHRADVTVCYDADEGHLIVEILKDFIRERAIFWHALDKPDLLNRNIGRNLAAKATDADWVWFADADYLFGPGSLEAVDNLDPHAACMYFPRIVLRPPDGDWYDDWPEGTTASERCTVPRRTRKAIGGCQIVPGHLARTFGYLDGLERHQRLATGSEFLDTRGDSAYRGWLQHQTGLPILAAEIPNVMRLRHRIPATSQRHKMTEEQFRLYDKEDRVQTPENADTSLPDSG